MRNLKFLSVLMILFAGLFFVSCEKDLEENYQTKQEVSFGINHLDLADLKSDEFDIECTGEEAVTAEIMIDGFNDPFTPTVFYQDGNLYTQVIKLNSGTYTVTSFKLLDAQGNIVMATPAEGSDYAVYVNETVDFELVVPEFDKVERSVEVLCYNEADYGSFGFNWFNVGEVEVYELFFFGDLCFDPVEYEGSLYDTHFDLGQYPFDIPAIFEIKTFVDVDGNWEELKTFGNIVDGQYVSGPVTTEYFTHSNGVVDFKFELWVYVQTQSGVVNEWEYVLFDEILFDSENPLEATSANNVIDFVVGDCFYEGTPPQFNYDPHTPIEFTGPIVIPGVVDDCTEKMAEARWRNFRSNDTGWDMAVGTEVGTNNAFFTESDWSGGYYLNGDVNYITLSYDGTDQLTVSVQIGEVTHTSTHNVGDLADADFMEIMVRAAEGQTVNIGDAILGGLPLVVNFTQNNSTGYWNIQGFDFSTAFSFTGELIINGEAPGQEHAKVNVVIGEIVDCPQ